MSDPSLQFGCSVHRDLHIAFGLELGALTRISGQLQGWVSEAAEQLGISSVWQLCCDHLKQTLAAMGPTPTFRLLPNYANASANCGF